MSLGAAFFHGTKSPVRHREFQLLPYNASSKSACGRPLSKRIPHPIDRDGIEGPDPWLAHTKRQFPVTDIIRKSPRFDEKYSGVQIENEAGYTPEPDIFHDVQAHTPFLMNKDYANFMWEIGLLGYEIIKDKKALGRDLVMHNLIRLQNFS